MDTVYYTVKEIAALLKVSTRTILDRIRADELKAFKIGKDWRVSKKNLEEWIQRQMGDQSVGD